MAYGVPTWKPRFLRICSSDFKSDCLTNPVKFMGQSQIPANSLEIFERFPIVPSWGLLAGSILGVCCSQEQPFFGGDESWSQKKKEAFFALVPSWTPQKVVLLFDSPGTMEFELRIVATIP